MSLQNPWKGIFLGSNFIKPQSKKTIKIGQTTFPENCVRTLYAKKLELIDQYKGVCQILDTDRHFFLVFLDSQTIFFTFLWYLSFQNHKFLDFIEILILFLQFAVFKKSCPDFTVFYLKSSTFPKLLLWWHFWENTWCFSIWFTKVTSSDGFRC